METKERIAFLTAVVFVIGGAYGGMLGLVRLAVFLLPGIGQEGAVPGIWFYLALPLIILVLLLGAMLGSAAWLLLMRFWFPREYLRRYFTSPEIPLLTPLMARFFELLYPAGD